MILNFRGLFNMMSERAKLVTSEIRKRLKAEGISNRNVSVVCRKDKENGKVIETIYVVNKVRNEAIDSYFKPIFEQFQTKYQTENLYFLYLSAVNCSNLENILSDILN